MAGDCSEQRVLLLGKGGMLWRAWDELLDSRSVPHHSPSLDEFDFLRPETIEKSVTADFTLVVNAAGYTDVDACEAEEQVARTINGAGVGQLARRCAALDVRLLHFSTDYVFDGRAERPYPVDASRSPLNAYGRTKALGEELLESSGCDYLLVRTSWLYAPWGRNFVRTVARRLDQRNVLKVVDDQRGRPTSAEHLADTSLRLLRRGASGTYHVTDGGECTWFELAGAIGELRQAKCRIAACTSGQYPRPAARPAYGVLDLGKTIGCVGPLRGWRDNLADVVARLPWVVA